MKPTKCAVPRCKNKRSPKRRYICETCAAEIKGAVRELRDGLRRKPC